MNWNQHPTPNTQHQHKNKTMMKAKAILVALLGASCYVDSFTSPPVKIAPKLISSRLDSSTTSSDIDFAAEAKEIAECASIVASAIFKSDQAVTAEDIVRICDTLDETTPNQNLFVSRELELRRRSLEIQRYEWLAKLMKVDYDAYVATASFLSPSRISRKLLPNLQDVPIDKNVIPKENLSDDGFPLVADCELSDMAYTESPLDKILLSIFRKLVVKNTGGITSEKGGIEGLLEQGRTYMLQPGQTPEAQHKMVSDTLGGLMTPVLPPFYRIFMSGIVPKLGTDYDGKQFGPWFYAPFLTSFVTPTFFGFLVGPSYPNRRKGTSYVTLCCNQLFLLS